MKKVLRMVYWFYLMGAIVFEVLGTMALKYSAVNNSTLYSWLTALLYLIAFTLLWYAIKKIDIGTAYAIWAGIGTALIAVLGVVIFKEDMTLIKASFILMIIVGAVGLKYVSGGH